jgi:hypothetical protein
MKLKVKRASNYNYEADLEVNNLRQLKDFIEDEGPIILGLPSETHKADKGYDLILTIYDDYME